MSPSPELHAKPALRLSRRTQIVVLCVAAAAAGLAGGATLLARGRKAVAEPAAASDGAFHPTRAQWASFDIRPVQVMQFQDEQHTDGRISTDDDRTTAVYSPFTGRVDRVMVRAGDSVARGQPLFAVSASEYLQAQSDLGAARAAVDTARAQLKAAQADEARLHELYKADGASLKDWQAAQVALATAQANARSADVALGAVRNRLLALGETGAKIAALEAAAAAHRVDPLAVVYAPVSGTVVTRQVQPGQFLASASSGGGATPALTVSDLSRVWLIANVREADAGRVHVGDAMDVRVMAIPGRVFHARTTYVGPTVDPVTRRVAVRAEIDNPERLLKPEMFADFSISTGPSRASPAVPAAAVAYEGQTAHVWVARRDGALVVRPVAVGRSRDGFLEVVSGLQPGDRVATGGALFVDRAAQAG